MMWTCQLYEVGQSAGFPIYQQQKEHTVNLVVVLQLKTMTPGRWVESDNPSFF